jgi:GAF domain-containing protein
MSDVHVAFFQEALARLRTAEEQLERMEESLHELERLTRALSHEGWQAFWDRAGSVGYRFDPGMPAGESAEYAGVVPAGHFWAPEVGEAARRKAFVLPASGGRSMAVAPLKAYARGVHGHTGEDGLFVGVLGVDDDPGNPLSPEDLELIRSAAELVAQALESTRLFEETQRRVHEANMLFNVSRALASAPLEAKEIGEIIVRQFVEVMGISEAAISLLNAKDGMLYVTADFMRAGEVGGDTGEGMRPVGTPGRPLETPTVYRLADYPATMAAMETLQPLVVQASDPYADPAELAFMSKYGRKTLVILPLAIKGRSIGILELESRDKEYRYTAEQIDLAMTLANQAAVALENARLFEETQAALAEVQAAHRSYLRQEWGEHLRQQEMLERSGLMYDHLQAGSAGETSPGVPPRVLGAELGSTVSKETAGVEAPTDRAVLVPGLWRPEMERAVVEGGPIVVRGGNGDEERASLAVPITLRGQTLGVIGVESPAGDRQWTEDEVALIEAVGEQLGQALETARLFADTQRRAERERLVGEITAKIRGSTDVRAILQTTAVELGQLLGTSRTLVRLTQTPGETSEDEGRR